MLYDSLTLRDLGSLYLGARGHYVNILSPTKCIKTIHYSFGSLVLFFNNSIYFLLYENQICLYNLLRH